MTAARFAPNAPATAHAGGPATLLRELFDAALAVALPSVCLPPHLPEPPRGRTIVLGAGKAAASMAKAFEEHWTAPCDGLVVTRYRHGCPTRRIAVMEASHPVPDAAGLTAARLMLERTAGLAADDLVVFLVSGGGSALLALPGGRLTLEQKQDVNRQLLHRGADIAEMNCVRKHLSAVKGGRLAMAANPARVVTLAISDVVGDDPAAIASGPTVADPTTLAMARDIIRRYGIACGADVMRHLEDPANETPKPGDPRLARSEFRLAGTPSTSLAAAAAAAGRAGYEVLNLGDRVAGDAGTVAREHAALALEQRRAGRRLCILSGGETTVVVTGGGRGGRNCEYLLALARALDGAPGIHAIACDTDGIDGSEDNAGAVIGPDTLDRARAFGLDPADAAARNDSYAFFAALGDLVVTGPTLTNVNDFRAILVG